MTHDEMIAVIAAHKEGKVIEWRHKSVRDAWEATPQPSWNFTVYEYRIKPEPREWWLTPATACGGTMFATQTKPIHGDVACLDKPIRVREVIE